MAHQNSLFLGLTLELRDHIYGYLLTSEWAISHLRDPAIFPNLSRNDEYVARPYERKNKSSYESSYANLMPHLAILAVNKQVHHEAQTVLLRENRLHFRNTSIPTGQSLDLFKRANRFDILVLNHLQYLDEVMAFLVAHPNLHWVDIEIDLDSAVYDYDPHVEQDKSRSYHAESKRWCRFTKTIEPLRHLPSRDGIYIELAYGIWSEEDDKWIQSVWGDTMQFVEQMNFDMY